MKQLLLIRHAKSSWETGEADFERPLNGRGKKDAPAMAERLLKRDIKIDSFVSSSARRARETAELFAKKYKLSAKDIRYIPELYLAGPVAIYKAIEGIDNKYASAAIFSHNPGITQMANTLTGVQVDDMPTCAIFAVKAHTEHWTGFEQAEKEFWFFDYPKNLIMD